MTTTFSRFAGIVISVRLMERHALGGILLSAGGGGM